MKRVRPFEPVYPVSPPLLSKGGLLAWAGALLDAGAKLVQYREKGIPDLALFNNCEALVKLFEPYGATLIINDRPDVALATGASGVHLGGDDLPAKDARKMLGEMAVVGFSTHCPEEAEAAFRLHLDYIALGPAYPTRSKQDTKPLVSARMKKEVVEKSPLPVVAIGGVTLERAIELWQLGFDCVAAIEAFRTEPAGRFKEFMKAFEGLRPLTR